MLALVHEEQVNDEHLQIVPWELEEKSINDFSITEDGMIRFRGRVCMPTKEDVRSRVLGEAYRVLTLYILGSRRCIMICEGDSGGMR